MNLVDLREKKEDYKEYDNQVTRIKLANSMKPMKVTGPDVENFIKEQT